MVEIKEDDTFTQIVRFDVSAEKQDALIAAIVGEVERWVRRRPDFMSSTFHASHDRRHVINYAQWEDEASFRGFTEDPEGERTPASGYSRRGSIAEAECRSLPRRENHRRFRVGLAWKMDPIRPPGSRSHVGGGWLRSHATGGADHGPLP
ncbi:antibiotic biosynthesis monooxygenase family protein [Cupriavidus necator]|uniref:antibiotic biosynthesis monooxygenase family protein n=1 Tax=Cupriavidus necator TaxID=106590 RepID=UPI001E370078|nr:antibiotic biosynthesis monooxygenase [Cupriavidus necator]